VAGDGSGGANRFDELRDGMFGQTASDVGFADNADQAMTVGDE
jgi:hypothetical protein